MSHLGLNKCFLFIFSIELFFVIYKLIEIFFLYDIYNLINLIDKTIFTSVTIILIRNRLKFIRLYFCFLSSLINLLLLCILILYYEYKLNLIDFIGNIYFILIFLFLSKIDSEILLPIKDIYKKEINETCIICYSDDKKTSQLLCDHSFHKECIEIWFKTSRTCPICRYQF
jgi:hypothetical protein